jgi:hypothetical protein
MITLENGRAQVKQSTSTSFPVLVLMEELHTDSIDGGSEANYGLGHVPGRGRTPTLPLEGALVSGR